MHILLHCPEGRRFEDLALPGAVESYADQTRLVAVTVPFSGFVVWRRHKREGQLGAPQLPAAPAQIGGVAAIILVLAGLLPLLAASLILLWLFDLPTLPRLPRLGTWRGVHAHHQSKETP